MAFNRFNKHHDMDHVHGHSHSHGPIDPAIATTARGIWAVKWSFWGLFITIVILRIVWQSTKSALIGILDGVDPHLVDEIRNAIAHVENADCVSDVRVRWLGHRLHAEVNLSLIDDLSTSKAHDIAMDARHEIQHHLPQISNVIVHVDPPDVSGEIFHRTKEHAHGEYIAHTHS
jgi:divalent metal cation (Fe/Co/Zn/Cd) transporter